MVIVAYYTPDYATDFRIYLEQSLRRVDGIRFEGIPVEDRGNWSLNTYYTAPVILKALDKYPNDAIVKVGADAFIHEYPKHLEEIEKSGRCDVAITYRPQDAIEQPECSTVLVMNNDKGRYFCNKWNEACEKAAKELKSVFSDQDALWTVMPEILKTVRVEKIPYAYGQSWHFNKKEHGHPVIEEFRTSWHHNRNRV